MRQSPDPVKNETLTLSPGLLMLERGEDELLLCDPELLRPVYLRRGGSFVRQLLSRAANGISRETLYKQFANDKALLQLLERQRILQGTAQEEKVAEQLLRPALQTSPMHTRVVYLTLTTACNLNCVYCLGGRQDRGGPVQKMMRQTALRAVEQAFEQTDFGGEVEVCFFGGEPLQNWPLVKTVGEACLSEVAQRHPDKTLRLSMVSNLAEPPEDLTTWSLEHGMSFLCDIDGPQAVHDLLRPFKSRAGSWTVVTENVRRLAEAGVGVGLRMTLTALNQGHMMETARLFRQLGGRSCAFVPVQPVDCLGRFLRQDLLPDMDVLVAGLRQVYESGLWTTENLFPLSNFRQRLQSGGVGEGPGCASFDGQTPVVSPSGEVYPCVYLAGNRQFCVGEAAGDRENRCNWGLLQGVRDSLLTSRLPECRNCGWRKLCGGGCAVPRLMIGPGSGASEKVKEYARQANCRFIAAAVELVLWELADEQQ